MKKQLNISGYYVLLTLMLAMGSCNIYRPYSRPEMKTDGLYRDPVSPTDTLRSDTISIGNLPWQQIFQDPKLQILIEQGLQNNLDLQRAILRVEEYQAPLTAARRAFFPSLAITPTAKVTSLDREAASQSAQIPLSSSWELDLFGRLLNAKRGAQAAMLQSVAYQQAVRSKLIGSIANGYYSLLMFDQQLSISEQTFENWKRTVETMKALKKAGLVNEAAVVQSEANQYAVGASIPELKRQIREMENAMSFLLGEPAQQIERSGLLVDQRVPEKLSVGVPVQLLANRPDVKQAEMALSAAYANTNVARASFYPQLSLSGALGGSWQGTAGVVSNPIALLATATANLVQPVFANGANRARLKMAKSQQEQARLGFQSVLLNAGNEVSNALFQYKTAEDKSDFRRQQILSLENSVKYTQQLLNLGTATYLEVITAQQSLLSAQLSRVSDEYQRMQAVVYVYQSLGGGRQ